MQEQVQLIKIDKFGRIQSKLNHQILIWESICTLKGALEHKIHWNLHKWVIIREVDHSTSKTNCLFSKASKWMSSTITILRIVLEVTLVMWLITIQNRLELPVVRFLQIWMLSSRRYSRWTTISMLSEQLVELRALTEAIRWQWLSTRVERKDLPCCLKGNTLIISWTGRKLILNNKTALIQ